MDRSPHPLARNVSRLSHLDLPGAGQGYLAGDYAYVGHIPNNQRLGTSILDVRDPKHPKVLSQIFLDDPDSHSHKARVAGDIVIVNSERNMTPIGRRAEELPRLRARRIPRLRHFFELVIGSVFLRWCDPAHMYLLLR